MSSVFLDFYHVICFEKIADLSQADFLGRLQPITRATYPLLNVPTLSVLDGHSLLDGGAERLILEWKIERGKRIDEQAGVQQEPIGPTFENLSQRAGCSTFKSQEISKISNTRSFSWYTPLHRLIAMARTMLKSGTFSTRILISVRKVRYM
jgi:hypothetical protein